VRLEKPAIHGPGSAKPMTEQLVHIPDTEKVTGFKALF